MLFLIKSKTERVKTMLIPANKETEHIYSVFVQIAKEIAEKNSKEDREDRETA